MNVGFKFSATCSAFTGFPIAVALSESAAMTPPQAGCRDSAHFETHSRSYPTLFRRFNQDHSGLGSYLGIVEERVRFGKSAQLNINFWNIGNHTTLLSRQRLVCPFISGLWERSAPGKNFAPTRTFTTFNQICREHKAQIR